MPLRHHLDIWGKPLAHLSFHAYHGPITKQREYAGGRVEAFIVDLIDWEKDTRQEGDAIYIDCSAEALRSIMQQWQSLLDANEHFAMKHHDEFVARLRLCPRCGREADCRSEWHGNGKGRACYGLAKERLALVEAETADAERQQALEDARTDDAIDPSAATPGKPTTRDE